MTASRDRSSLPKWAQRDLERLEGDLKLWKSRATAGPDNSDTFIKQWTEDDTPLGQSPHIAFRWPDPKHFRGEAELTVRRRNNSIEIMGTDSLVITSQAANVIYVQHRERFGQ